MKPIPVTDDMVGEGQVKRVFMAPPDMPDVYPCEAVICASPDGKTVHVRVPMKLEPGDLENLKADGTVWMTMVGNLLPFSVETAPAPPEPAVPPVTGDDHLTHEEAEVWCGDKNVHPWHTYDESTDGSHKICPGVDENGASDAAAQ